MAQYSVIKTIQISKILKSLPFVCQIVASSHNATQIKDNAQFGHGIN